MSDLKQHSSIYLVTGKVQGGKTTYLNKLAGLLRKKGVTVGGFLCPGLFEAGERSSFSLINILTGAELPMASMEARATWIHYRRFWFDPETFSQGKIWIKRSLLQKVQVMVIDEVGPMELEGAGWSELLDHLPDAPVPVQLWSVRETLLGEVMQRWNIPDGNIIPVSEVEEFRLSEMIIATLKDNQEFNQTS